MAWVGGARLQACQRLHKDVCSTEQRLKLETGEKMKEELESETERVQGYLKVRIFQVGKFKVEVTLNCKL